MALRVSYIARRLRPRIRCWDLYRFGKGHLAHGSALQDWQWVDLAEMGKLREAVIWCIGPINIAPGPCYKQTLADVFNDLERPVLVRRFEKIELGN